MVLWSSDHCGHDNFETAFRTVSRRQCDLPIRTLSRRSDSRAACNGTLAEAPLSFLVIPPGPAWPGRTGSCQKRRGETRTQVLISLPITSSSLRGIRQAELLLPISEISVRGPLLATPEAGDQNRQQHPGRNQSSAQSSPTAVSRVLFVACSGTAHVLSPTMPSESTPPHF